MVSIAAHTKADDFSIDFRTTRFCMFVLFKHQHTGTVAQYKTIAFFIPRTARRLWVIVAGRQRARCAKTTYAQRRTGFFCATCHHRVRITIGDDTRGMADVMHA
ncbi:Uncharacterised protein [Salmonella enterica subsp. enterica serovar Typhi]|nr:Uncharacterised protein [Salmonella enterica subsp. enterica serovar Typhi]